jgi:hypothetical protein
LAEAEAAFFKDATKGGIVAYPRRALMKRTIVLKCKGDVSEFAERLMWSLK